MKIVLVEMSVVSSRVSSVSSILKASGVRAQFVKQPIKLCKLPKDVKDILCNFTKGNGTKEYEKLIYSLKTGAIKDSDLAEFLMETTQCISLLDIRYKLFVQALLQIDWLNRAPDVILNYKLFLKDLVCMQTVYTNIVINRLVELFKPTIFEDSITGHKIGQFKDEDIEKLNHIHDILHIILKVMPMSNEVLLESLRFQFPLYVVHGAYIHEIYIYALLKVLNYAPQLRSAILVLIIDRLTKLDVNIPREEASSDEKDDVADDCVSYNDEDNLSKINNDTDRRKTVHPIAHTLDSCMELFLKYMDEFCFVNKVLQIENLKILYDDIVYAFETIILRTYASRYVQYIMFYICSFSPMITKKFIEWLWFKITNPNEPVLQQTAVCYVSSMHATASFISPGLVQIMMSRLAQWIHRYITLQENSESIDAKSHDVFYSVCQAFFHLFVARHEHFVVSKDGLSFLHDLDISRIVTCKLNPLKMCDTKIVCAFADITFTYQLAYCHTVIENNKRNQLPTFGIRTRLAISVPHFFPFESYTLEYSGQKITPLFRNN